MSPLSPGANAPLPPGPLEIAVRHGQLPGADLDVSAFLLTASGKVRDDGDMCFYGQTGVDGGAVRLCGTATGETGFAIDPGALAPEIDRVVLAATIHENRATFGALEAIGIEASGRAGSVAGEIPCAGREETALILAEIYRRGDGWKLRIVGQGFRGGLAPLAGHFGVAIAAPAAPPARKPPPASPVRLGKVSLTKRGETAKISLRKETGLVRVTARWIDNGDARSDNDDLDLRAGILMPDGSMHWLAASHPGALDAPPHARHCGDVLGASADRPGEEVIEVSTRIAERLGGPVGMVFSVYSAVSNGAVSIASLKPRMLIEHGDERVECSYDFPDGKVAERVYTYIIGTIDISGSEVEIRLSGATSPQGSEATPWIARTGDGLVESFDGVPVFKKGRGLMARMMGAGKKKYANV